MRGVGCLFLVAAAILGGGCDKYDEAFYIVSKSSAYPGQVVDSGIGTSRSQIQVDIKDNSYPDRQLWTDAGNKVIQNMAIPSVVLGRFEAQNLLHFFPRSGDPSQEFVFDGDFFMVQGLAAEVDSQGHIRFSPRDPGNDRQKWSKEYKNPRPAPPPPEPVLPPAEPSPPLPEPIPPPTEPFPDKFYIESASSRHGGEVMDSMLGVVEGINPQIRVTRKDEADPDRQLWQDGGGRTVANVKRATSVLDRPRSGILYSYPRHAKPNQQYVFQDGFLMNQGDAATINSEGYVVFSTKDQSNDLQKWKIMPYTLPIVKEEPWVIISSYNSSYALDSDGSKLVVSRLDLTKQSQLWNVNGQTIINTLNNRVLTDTNNGPELKEPSNSTRQEWAMVTDGQESEVGVRIANLETGMCLCVEKLDGDAPTYPTINYKCGCSSNVMDNLCQENKNNCRWIMLRKAEAKSWNK